MARKYQKIFSKYLNININKDNLKFCTSHRLLDERKQILKKEIKRINKVLNDRVTKS